MKTAIAYVRVSTAQQGRSGLGIEAQHAALARFAEAEGYDLVETFEEVETGKGERCARSSAAAIGRAQASAPAQGSDHRGQARSAEPRRPLHQRADDPQNALHRRRAGR